MPDPARLFWLNFFAILRPTVALGQWTTLVVTMGGLFATSLPLWTHLAGPLALLGLNSVVLSQPPPSAPLLVAARRLHVRVGFISLFCMAFVLVSYAFFALAWMLAALIGFAGPAYWSFVLRFSAYGILLVAAAMVYGYIFGQDRLTIERLEVQVPGLPDAFDGMRLVQLSDIHLGPFMTPERLSAYIDEVNRLEPDLVCITGDIAADLEGLRAGLGELSRLRARYGVFAILGNHDAYCGADRVAGLIEEATEFRLLRDEVAVIESDGQCLHLLGIEDRGGPEHFRGLKQDERLDRLRRQVPEGIPFVLLIHRPDLFEQAAGLGASLVLAGHTHGGQLAFPWPRRRPLSIARFITPWPRGTYSKGPSVLHVNRGLGMTGQPIRLATPRELTVIRLAKATPGLAPETGALAELGSAL